jgi:hypothetical protein
MLTAAVSGSFHRHMAAITAVVHELATLSVRVLSPADPRVVAQQGEFIFVASDRLRSVRLVQDRHLESVRAADFLWLVCPDGYVGQSASMEIGFAAGAGTPIFASHPPCDLTLREYVTLVPGISDAIRSIAARPRPMRAEGLLIDPHASIQEAHRILEGLDAALTSQCAGAEGTEQVRQGVTSIRERLALPSYLQ